LHRNEEFKGSEMDRHLLIAAALLAAMHLMPAQAQSISTFGKTAASGATASAGLTANFKRASRFTLTEPATVKDICVYLDGNGGGSGLQFVHYALYTDVNGVPARKVFDGPTWALTNGASGRWICRPGDYIAAAIPAGQYWIAILSSGPAGVIRTFSSGSAQNWYGNADSYNDGPADSFGSGSAGAGTLAAYVRYYPESQMRNAGRTTIGTLVSRGMTANFKRGSSFVLPGRGRLFAITAYLDGRGSTSSQDQQAYRYVIYKDASGVPGEKVYESDSTRYRAGGWVPMWVSEVIYPDLAPTLDAGRYWLTIHSGGLVTSGGLTDTGGVIRYFYDHIGNWYGNDDAFMDRASTPFAAGTAKNDLISAFVSYRPGTITTGQLGRTDIGTTPSRGLDPDVVRWSRFPMDDGNATLTGLHAYLDGMGSTGGSQAVRMVLYEYNFQGSGEGGGESVYEKIAQSEVVNIAAGMQPQWVHFTVPSVPLPNRQPPYLIGIHSAGPDSVARVYGDNRPGANWYGRPDTFANGADSSILESDTTVKAGSVTLSVYASYSMPPP
jgi:hypothetical protein